MKVVLRSSGVREKEGRWPSLYSSVMLEVTSNLNPFLCTNVEFASLISCLLLMKWVPSNLVFLVSYGTRLKD